MEGAAARDKRAYDLGIAAAWHTAVFALKGYDNKLKPLSKYLTDDRPKDARALQYARGIAFFHRMKAAGFPVEITRH